MTKENRQRAIYVVSDLLTSAIALLIFNIVRYHWFVHVEGLSLEQFLSKGSVVAGMCSMPMLMLGIFYLSGSYFNVIYRSRVDEFLNTLLATAIGSVLIFFIVVANDNIDDRGTILETVLVLWGALLTCVYAARLVITMAVVRRMHTRRVGFNTLIIGTSAAAVNLVKRLNTMRRGMGFNILGYVSTDEADVLRSDDGLPVFSIDNLGEICRERGVVSLIVLPHRGGIHATLNLINRLYPLGTSIYISPMLFQLIAGKSSLGNVAGEPLIDIAHPDVSPSTASIKRASDFVGSAIALLLLSPVFLVLAIAVKLDSPGSIFYRQERIGYHKRRFNIIKFRTMSTDAEADGPMLSTPGDPRITRVGAFLRKYRLDELPQFWNVLRGDMSIVGPRPEREFYANQIVERVPYYTLIHSVRPGITSWGMVKYGYATTIDEMIERLKYDLIYLENISVGIDLKIIVYTVRTVVTGKGI